MYDKFVYYYFYRFNTSFYREVRKMIREGANPNNLLRRKGGLSPFHLSVGLGGHKAVDIVAVLLDGRGDPNNKSGDGLTPLHIAGKISKSHCTGHMTHNNQSTFL